MKSNHIFNMDITPLVPTGKHIITSYGGGGFKINSTSHNGNIIITDDCVKSWNIGQFEDVNTESLVNIFKNTNTEILIVGCGSTHIRVTKELQNAFRQVGISVEVMVTGAACRTYNVLLGEGRNVSAALVAVS